jgi:hypothetical protein
LSICFFLRGGDDRSVWEAVGQYESKVHQFMKGPDFVADKYLIRRYSLVLIRAARCGERREV